MNAGTESMTAVRATVARALPNELFLVMTDDGREFTVHVSGKLRNAVVRLLPGDRVLVDASPFDATKGRVVLQPGRPLISEASKATGSGSEITRR